MNSTVVPGKWVHGLCALWVPEVFTCDEQNGAFDLSNVDKTRYKIKCQLCPKKDGIIIQCAYGRCVAGAHPFCAVRCKRGFTSRIVKDPDRPETLLWEVFCKQHATAVYDPVKPKVCSYCLWGRSRGD